MRFSWATIVAALMLCLPLAGCGSNEPTSVDSDELQQYVEDNAAQLAEEDAALEAEDEAEDEDDD